MKCGSKKTEKFAVKVIDYKLKTANQKKLWVRNTDLTPVKAPDGNASV